MIIDTLHLGDIGDILILDLPVDSEIPSDLGSATTEILYEKPDTETKGSWDADLNGDLKAEYETAEGDIDQVGIWKLQVKVVVDGITKYGNIVFLKVLGDVEEVIE